MEALQEADLIGNTIVVFTSDNGALPWGVKSNRGYNWPLRGGKFTLWEGGLRTTAFIWSPLLEKNRRVSNQMMHIADWLPTLYSAAEAVRWTLQKELKARSVNRQLEAQNIIMVYNNEWDDAAVLAGIKGLRFSVGYLEVGAYHVAPSEGTCCGVILGARMEFTNEETLRRAGANRFEVLDARSLSRSQAVVITFAGKQVPYTVDFE
ncbi:hypothetical protein HPB47_004013 [Ixodes persulcatus]|uniref:Uncharacterized protein n=1 Tax=Ixodes persulcatus TaxID=34615 RepID=A0AC60PH32_IXOPE|nr:hypothetical protein HPB47_004013 [Ixodes persulcatus]